MRSRRLLISFVLLGGLAGAVAAGMPALRRQDRSTPTTGVSRGTVSVKVHAEGELRSRRAEALVAPPVEGSLQIVRMAATGAHVRAGESVVEFDPGEQEYKVGQSRSELVQAEQEIAKLQADAAVQMAQDQVAMLKARFAVRSAELELKGNELIGAIQAQRNQLTFEEAERTLTQLREDIRSHAASSNAELEVLKERRNKAQLSMRVAQKNIESMTLRAPIDGIVVAKENQDAAGGFFFYGMTLPDYRQGDTVSPGEIVAELVAARDVEILAKIEQTERGNLEPGQAAEIRLEAVPGEHLPGRIETIGAMTGGRFWDGDVRRPFDVVFSIDKPDPRLRPGQTVQIVVSGPELKDVVYVPRQAVFDRQGKTIVYVRIGERFEPREIILRARTESHVVVENLASGLEVALVNPEAAPRAGQSSSAASKGLQ